MPDSDAIRRYLDKPWSNRSFPGAERYTYSLRTKEYCASSLADAGIPGSDRERLEAAILGDARVCYLVLVPLTRGLNPNLDLGTAICRATNRWLAEEWLSEDEPGPGLYGTVRVNPSDPVAAVAEIERYADHPRMVQIGVPVQSHHPYGQRMYHPVWDAAAASGLPVVLHTDGGASVDYPPSPVGFFRRSSEYNTYTPLNAIYHVASFIAEGVLDRLPELRIVCGEGALSVFVPILWRMNKDWRSAREEIPWVTKMPEEYVRHGVRFVLHRADLPRREIAREWWEIANVKDLAIYGGNYPFGDYLPPDEAVAAVGAEAATRVMLENARTLYRLR
jgi:predicted TIM-barrel fold metal-dependent hydrolase